MNEENFRLMEGAANAMCDSLENDPWRWREDPCTLVDTKVGVEYWIGGSGYDEIISIWDGHSAKRVFSVEQGLRIQSAFQKMKQIKASEAQQRVIYSFSEIREVKEPPGLIARLFSWLP